MSATPIAAGVCRERVRAASVVETALAHIAERDPGPDAFTAVLADRGRTRAAWADRGGTGSAVGDDRTRPRRHNVTPPLR
jgi:Asp-tRNA(Asn)/Glu-tRNA(Gln) amidotransferase A subunit family amidase